MIVHRRLHTGDSMFVVRGRMVIFYIEVLQLLTILAVLFVWSLHNCFIYNCLYDCLPVGTDPFVKIKLLKLKTAV